MAIWILYEEEEVVNHVLPSQIKAYTIVEDWFFDKEDQKWMCGLFLLHQMQFYLESQV